LEVALHFQILATFRNVTLAPKDMVKILERALAEVARLPEAAQ
jgi:hypothetical protein